MQESHNYIELKVELEKPAELYDLVRSFTALASQFDEYIRAEYPQFVDSETKIYVEEIRSGSIIADLVPIIQPLIQNMDSALIIDGFINRYGGLLKGYANGKRKSGVSKSDLNDFMGQIASIAKDKNGSLSISSAEFHQTKRTMRAAVTFNSIESRQIEEEASSHRKTLEAKAYEVVSNVLMVFWQSNIKEAKLGKRSGEKAIIEEVTRTPLAVIYESDLAEAKIKGMIVGGDQNVFKKGFYVTCRIERLNERPVAYRISEVHEVIDLPDDGT